MYPSTRIPCLSCAVKQNNSMRIRSLLLGLIIGVALIAAPFAYSADIPLNSTEQAGEAIETKEVNDPIAEEIAENCLVPASETVRMEVFEREDCGHCRDEKARGFS